MTDRERLIELLEDFGVGWQTSEARNEVVLEAQVDARVVGYTYFTCRWEFDDEGNFQVVGVWE